MIQTSTIKTLLTEKANQLIEAKFIRVIRRGLVVRKRVVRPGFKIVRVKGGRTKIKRISPAEKRHRHFAELRAWKKGHTSRIIKSRRILKKSLLRRKIIFGG